MDIIRAKEVWLTLQSLKDENLLCLFAITVFVCLLFTSFPLLGVHSCLEGFRLPWNGLDESLDHLGYHHLIILTKSGLFVLDMEY